MIVPEFRQNFVKVFLDALINGEYKTDGRNMMPVGQQGVPDEQRKPVIGV